MRSRVQAAPEEEASIDFQNEGKCFISDNVESVMGGIWRSQVPQTEDIVRRVNFS